MSDDFDYEPRRRPMWQQVVVWMLVLGLVITLAGAAFTMFI